MKLFEKLSGASKIDGKRKVVAILAAVAVLGAGAVAVSGKGGQLMSLLVKGGAGSQVAVTLSGIKEPERSADIAGIVTEVSGNQMKIMLLNVGDLPGGARPGGSGASGAAEGGMRQRPTAMPEDGQMDRSAAGASTAKAARSAMLTELKKKSIGEATVTVPVGIQMIKMGGTRGAAPSGQAPEGGQQQMPQPTAETKTPQGGANGGQPRQMTGQAASFTDLAENSVVKIWLDSSSTDVDRIAEFVSIMG